MQSTIMFMKRGGMLWEKWGYVVWNFRSDGIVYRHISTPITSYNIIWDTKTGLTHTRFFASAVKKSKIETKSILLKRVSCKTGKLNLVSSQFSSYLGWWTKETQLGRRREMLSWWLKMAACCLLERRSLLWGRQPRRPNLPGWATRSLPAEELQEQKRLDCSV